MYKKLLENAIENDLNKLDIKKFEASLTQADKDSIDHAWFKVYCKKASYCDNLYDVIAKACDLPLVPQEYHGDVTTKLEIKLKNKAYETYYNKVKAIAENPKANIVKVSSKLSKSDLELHEKLLTAYYLSEQYKKLGIDNAIITMTTKQQKASIFYVWYDCCGRIKDSSGKLYLVDLLTSIIKSQNGETNEAKLLEKYEKSYSKMLQSKIQRGLK